MCDPITASVVLAVATSAATSVSQIKAAKKQAAAVNNQMALAATENQRVASAELFDQARAARIEQGRTTVSAGEAGLSLTSGSIQGLLTDIAMQKSLQGDRSIANMESRHAQNVAEGESMMSQISKPTLLGAGLQMANAGFGAYTSANALKIQSAGASSSAAAAATG